MQSSVSIIKCASYDTGAVFDAVKQAVDLLGGMSAFVKPGDRVLIKPNLLKARPPETAVTTHPELVRAAIRLVRGAGGTALVGDSPGIGDLTRVCERSGVMSVLEQEGATLVAFDEPVEVKGRGRFQRFEVARPASEADVIINLPKLKTHGMTTLTGAVKNLFGCVPGKRKVQWHFRTGVDHGSFTRMLVELCALLGPKLTIMDAVVAMEGNGPGSGDPRTVGAILAGADPVAVDVAAGAMVGVDPGSLPVLAAAAAAGVGAARLEDIQVLGEPLSQMLVRRFRIPPREHPEWRIPEWARRGLKDALTTRPLIAHGSCIDCGVCAGHCPQSAISRADGRLWIDYRKCIRCFCCQEFCPQGAISVGKGWALRLLRAK